MLRNIAQLVELSLWERRVARSSRVIPMGSVAEWFKAAVLKTAELKGSVSSNLTASVLKCWVSIAESGG